MAWFNDIHATQKFRLGTRVRGVNTNEYIYLQGVASTVQYDWVTFDEAHLTTRAVADGQGRVAIAQAAVVADQYGWYLIYGNGYANALTGFADNGKVYLTGTAGSVDDADVAGDAVMGAWGRSALNATGNPTGTALFELSWPAVHDLAFD